MKVKNIIKTLAATALWTILVAVCLCSVSVVTQAATKSDLTFTLNEDGESYSVTDCLTSATGTLTIPATYNGKPVTAIGRGAFQYCDLTAITIPDSVTRMEYNAIENCDNLKTISIPDSITSMEAYSFTSCDNLTYTVYNNAKYLGNENNPYVVLVGATSYDITSCKIHTKTKIVYGFSFTNCTQLASITIPNSVTYIGQSAFENCTGLKRVSIGNNVKHICVRAFRSCSSLTSITIPSGITSIDDAFGYCNNLTYTVHNNAKYLGNSNNPYVVLMDTVSEDITSCEIHTKTRIINEGAFKHCADLESITIPDSVISIDYAAFQGCTGLKQATIGTGVTDIGGSAFSYCSSLTSIAIPDGVTSIGASMFEKCSSLTDIIIPDSVTSIEAAAFYGCSSLTSITIPDGVTSIGNRAFSECYNLKSISIPDSITTIGSGVFEYCRYLTYHVYDNAKYLGNDKNHYVVLIDPVSQDVTSCSIHTETRVISESAFAGCVNLNSISIPDSVTYLGNYAFKNCTGLYSATIGNGVSGIGESTFEGCTGLKSVTLGNGIAVIDRKAFYNCSSLTGINIPDSVVSIGYSAFEGCAGLKSATIGNSVTEIGTKAFHQCISLTGIAIPDSVTVIGDNIFEGCASLKSAVIGNGVTRIGYYAFGYCGSLTDVTIGSGVKSIASWAFEHCGSLTQISIPKGVTDISCGFSHCYSLTVINVNKNNPNYSSVSGVLFNKAKTELLRVPCGFSGAYTVPESVTTVGGGVFNDCIHLTGVTVPKSVTILSGSAFDGCSSLKKISVNKNNPNFGSVSGVLFDKAKTKLLRVPCGKSGAYTVPDGVTAFGDYAFEDCTLLTEVTIPEGVQLIYYRLFSGCTHLKKITIPDSVNDIKYDAFTGCDSLQFNTYNNACYLGNAKNPYHALVKGVSKDMKTCKIHPKTKLIAEEAFLDYDHLTAITIPGSVEIVRPRAFKYCSGLSSLTIMEGVKEIRSDAFQGCTKLSKLTIPNGVVLNGSTFQNCTNLKTIFFMGDEQPYWGGSLPVFYGVTATAYYPVNNDTWDGRMSYWGDGLTWKSWTPFKLITQPKTAYAIVGDTAKVTVKVAGNGLKYQWYYKKAGDATYKLASVKKATYSCKMTAARNGRYLKCKITDQYGNSVWTKEVRLQMTDLAITTQPVSKAVKKGATAKFTVKPNGTTVTYQWQFRTSSKGSWKNTTAAGSKTKTLSVPATVARNGYQYRCRIRDSEGNTVYSNTVTLHVLAIKTQPVNKSVVAGKTAKFTVSAIGKELTFQWQYRTSSSGKWKNASATGNKTKALSVLAAAAKNGYQYRCRITDSAGNVIYSNTVTLKVKE